MSAVTAYVEARTKANDADAKARIIRKELLACLYVPAPEGFRRALALVDEIVSYPSLYRDAMVQLWAAAAFGQKAAWLKANGGDPAEFDRAADDALMHVYRVVELVPDASKKPRELLRSLFDPNLGGAISGNDDLQVFYGDDRFKALILRAE